MSSAEGSSISGSAPAPGSRRIDADIAEPAGARLLAGDAGEELGRKPVEECGCGFQNPKTVSGERQLQCRLRSRIAHYRIRNRSMAQPFPGRRNIGDPQQVETRGSQMAVTEPDNALDVI